MRFPRFDLGRPLFRAAFTNDGRTDVVLVALFALVNGLVLWNAVAYDPGLGYDAYEHQRYVEAFAEGRLPDARDSREFFSPPLPYAVPALVRAAGAPLETAVKVGQLLNIVYSLGLTLLVLLLAEAIRPSSSLAKRLALPLLGLVPVYPRVFAFYRAEPLLALLSALALLLALRLFVAPGASSRKALRLGLVLGLMMLARQQGLFVVGAVGLLAFSRAWAEPERRRTHLTRLVLSAVITLATSGWFYVSLWQRFGTPLAFNKPRAPFSFENRPSFFYLGTGDGKLFTDPVRSSFRGQFLPTMYADTWGDYYAYFLIYAYDHRRGGRFISPWEWDDDLASKRDRWWLATNRFSRAPYLGRVNLVSLLPTALFLAGLGFGLSRVRQLLAPDVSPCDAASALMALAVTLSLAGYFALLLTLKYPLGTTIKAAYMLPVFPFLAVLAAEMSARIGDWRPGVQRALVLALILVAVHNAPTLVTAYAFRPPAVAARHVEQEGDQHQRLVPGAATGNTAGHRAALPE